MDDDAADAGTYSQMRKFGRWESVIKVHGATPDEQTFATKFNERRNIMLAADSTETAEFLFSKV